MRNRFFTSSAVALALTVAVQGSMTAQVRENFPVAGNTPAKTESEYVYNVDPTPGIVDKLSIFVITIEGATTVEIDQDNLTYDNAPRVLDSTDEWNFCYGVECSGNTMTLKPGNEVNTDGEYRLVLPAGFYEIDGVLCTQEMVFYYTVETGTSEDPDPEEPVIITQEPVGVKVNCQTDFISWLPMGSTMPMAGKPTHYVIGEDDCLYLYNPIITHPFSAPQTQSYIKGVKDGDNYKFTFPQAVYTENNGELRYVNRMVESAGSYVVAEDNTVVFTIDEDGNAVPVENLNDGNSQETFMVGYSNDKGEWQYAGNFIMNYEKFDAFAMTCPGFLSRQNWIMEYNVNETTVGTAEVQVAFMDEDEVFVKGLSQIYLPDAWAHGIIDHETNTVTFDSYIGEEENIGQYVFLKSFDAYVVETPLMECTFNYDPETRAMSMDSDKGLLINPNNVFYYALESYLWPTIKPAVSGVERIEDCGESVATEWYNFQGMKVENPSADGMYIRVDIMKNGARKVTKCNL